MKGENIKRKGSWWERGDRLPLPLPHLKNSETGEQRVPPSTALFMIPRSRNKIRSVLDYLRRFSSVWFCF